MQWYEKFRNEFPAVQKEIYAEIALTNAIPTRVMEAVCSFLKRINIGENDKEFWQSDLMRIRRKVAEFINAKPHEIAFTKNTTEGLNIIAKGMILEPGDNIVVTDQEHPNNLLPWLNLRSVGIEIRTVKAVNYRLPVDHIWSCVDQRTRILAVSLVQYSSGFRVDINALGRLCHSAGIRLVVDGIQALGTLQLDILTGNIDALACGGHKSLFAPYGIGILYCNQNLITQLTPAYSGTSAAVGVNYNEKEWEVHIGDSKDAQRLEFGTLNYPGIFGLEAGIDILQEAGIDRIESRVLTLSSRLNAGLRNLGYHLHSPENRQEQSGIVVVEVNDPKGFWYHLKKAGIRATLMNSGLIRFSLHAYNLEWEIEKILEVAANYKIRF